MAFRLLLLFLIDADVCDASVTGIHVTEAILHDTLIHSAHLIPRKGALTFLGRAFGARQR